MCGLVEVSTRVLLTVVLELCGLLADRDVGIDDSFYEHLGHTHTSGVIFELILVLPEQVTYRDHFAETA